MNVREMIAQLQEQDPSAHVIIVDEMEGSVQEIDRVCLTEDNPHGDNNEVWIVPAESES